MEIQPPPSCRNCGAALPENARFCPQCSQKTAGNRHSLLALLKEFGSSLLNLDSQTFQTLKGLLVPGKLTAEYFQGHQVRYLRPLRVFLLSAAIFTAMLTYSLNAEGLSDLEIGLDGEKELFYRRQMELRLDTVAGQVAAEMQSTKVTQALDLTRQRFRQSDPDSVNNTQIALGEGEIIIDTTHEKNVRLSELMGDSSTLNTFINLGTTNKEIKVATVDLIGLDEDELVKKYGVTGFFNQLIFKQYVRINKGGKAFIFYLISNTIWLMLIMMPMLALMLKILYIRRNFLYYEHLIFSFHTHAFMFLTYTALLLVENNTITIIAVLGTTIYLYMAMKRFYKQSHAKTFLKYLMINFAYLLIFFLAALLTTVASAAFF